MYTHTLNYDLEFESADEHDDLGLQGSIERNDSTHLQGGAGAHLATLTKTHQNIHRGSAIYYMIRVKLRQHRQHPRRRA